MDYGSSWLHVRIDPSLKTLLKQIVEAREEAMSSFVRRAVKVELAKLSYLSEEQKKALGVIK